MDTDEDAVRYLLEALKPGQLQTLATLLQRISQDSGYGSLSLIISDRRVERFRVEQSYK